MPGIGIGVSPFFNRKRGINFAAYWATLNDHFDTDLIVPYNSGDFTVSADADKYEAWPNIAKDSLSNLYVVYRVADTNTHNYEASGRVVMRISTDNGETWGSEIVVSDIEDNDEHNAAILIFDNGGTETILVTYNSYDSFNTNFVCKKSTVADPSSFGSQISISTTEDGYGRGQPRLLSNGTILAPFNQTINGARCMLGKSTDGGDTWSNITAVGDYRQELMIIECKTGGSYTGKIYGVIRNSESPYGFYEIWSNDYGDTWTTKSLSSYLTTDKATPGEFLRYDSNTILFFTTDDRGGTVYVTTDESQTWALAGFWGGINTAAAAQPTYYPSPILLSSEIGVVWCTNSTASNVYFNKMSYPALKAPAGCKWGANRDGEYSVADGKLTIDGSQITIRSFAELPLPFVVEFYAKHTNALYIGLGAVGDRNKSSLLSGSVNIGIDSYYNRTEAEAANDSYFGVAPTEGEWKTYRIEYKTDKVDIYENDVLLLTKSPEDGSGIPNISPAIFTIYNFYGTGQIEIDYVGARPL